MSSRIDVLQYLAMHGLAETDELAEQTDDEDVEATLESLAADGWLEEDGFWYLSPSGEEHLNELCRDRFTESQLESIESIFDEFEVLDGRFKELSEEWQTSSDADGDAILEELASLHDDLIDLFSGLDDEVKAVYERYLGDLDAALAHLEDGERDYFTGTDVRSYHNVWFELHDDLLRTLGRERDE